MRGRRPQPTRLKLAKGTPPGRLNPAEPEPAGSLGAPPDRLSRAARAVWEAEAPYWATAADRGAWARYCEAVADAARFRQVCEAEGWWTKGSRGSLVKHPAARLYLERSRDAQRLAVEFGMTPSSRTRVSVPPPPVLDDPMAKFDDPAAEFD